MAKADLKVNNRRYSVACAPGQERRLAMLGADLDKRINEIADAVGDIGETRLFLIAALSLLDELDICKNSGDRATRETSGPDQDVYALLADATARIDALATRLGAAIKST